MRYLVLIHEDITCLASVIRIAFNVSSNAALNASTGADVKNLQNLFSYTCRDKMSDIKR